MERVIPSEKSHFLQVFILGCERHKRSNHNTLVLCPDNMKWRKLPRAHVSYLKISELMSPSRVSLQTNTDAVTCSGHITELLSRGGSQTHIHTRTHTKPSAAQLSAHGIIAAKMTRTHIPPPLWCLVLSRLRRAWPEIWDMTGCSIYLSIYFCGANQLRWGRKGRKQRGKGNKKHVCIYRSHAKFNHHTQQSGCCHGDVIHDHHHKIKKKEKVCPPKHVLDERAIKDFHLKK